MASTPFKPAPNANVTISLTSATQTTMIAAGTFACPELDITAYSLADNASVAVINNGSTDLRVDFTPIGDSSFVVPAASYVVIGIPLAAKFIYFKRQTFGAVRNDVTFSFGSGSTLSMQPLSSVAAPVILAGYSTPEDMLKVCSVQKKFRDSFPGTALDEALWSSSVGPGGSISVAGGLLTLNSGTTINSETWVMTNDYFTVPFRVTLGGSMSQRIADQKLYIEAISVDRLTGIPDGLHKCGWLFDGTTATSAKYVVQNSGIAELVSGSSTIPTTASGSYFELEPFADECWFHGGSLDSTNGRSNSYRRHQQIPDPNAVYKVRIRWVNGTIAPVSSTAAVVQFVAVQDYAELTAEITAGRGQIVAGQAVGVQITGGTSALSNAINNSIGVDTVAGVYGQLSSTLLTAGATYTSSVMSAFSSSYSQMNVSHLRISVQHAAGATGFGRLLIETYDTTSTTTPTSGQRVTYSVPVPSDGLVHTFLFPLPTKYYRISFTNGGSVTQTVFNLSVAYLHGGSHMDVETNIPFLLAGTALAASGTFTSAAIDLAGSRNYGKLSAMAFADQAGTLRIEQSWDNSTWRKTHEVAVSASVPALLDNSKIFMRYVRVVFVNGATLQGVFTLTCALEV